MNCNFEITNGIYLVQSPCELDLHNNFDFMGLRYSIKDRTLLLNWRSSPGETVASGTPSSVKLEFREVSEYRFLSRNAELPFTEDDCVVHLDIGRTRTGRMVSLLPSLARVQPQTG